MEHVDPEVLALVALGEPATERDRAHLDACARCAAEVASLAAAVAVGRTVRATDAPVAPSPAVWDRISAELGLGGAGTASPPAVAPVPAAVPGPVTVPLPAAVAVPVPTSTRASVADGDPTTDTARPAPVVPLRRRAMPWVAAAAACGVVVGGAGGAWWAGRDAVPPPADVVAQASLDPLPGWAAAGDARVEQAQDGGRTLVVTLELSGGDDGYHEVWLIDREVTRLVSLGVLTGTEGRFTVPPGLDLAEFPVVDVSDEPYDGDPSHSGDSIIRGILDA